MQIITIFNKNIIQSKFQNLYSELPNFIVKHAQIFKNTTLKQFIMKALKYER